MHARSKAFAVLVTLVATLLLPLSAEAAVSCKTVNKHYPNGVAASKYYKNVGDPIEKPKVKSSVYKKYKKLDVDKDGIVCELTIKKVQLSPSEQVLENAVSQVKSRLAKINTFSGEINYYVSDKYPAWSALRAVNSAKIGVSYFEEFYTFSGADFIFFTKDEIEWAQQKWNSITAGTRLYGLSVYNSSWKYPCRGAEFTYVKDGQTRHLTVQCDDGNQTEAVDFGAHGATHWFQGYYRPQYMPNWLVEGAATFYGEVIGYGPDNPLAKEVLWRGDYKLHNALKAGPDSVMAEIQKTTVQNPSYSISYTTSRMLYQALIGLYGEDRAIKFIQSFGSSSDVALNFFMVYNRSIDSFYEEAVPLLSAWAVRIWK
jgi:hypothetical protein